MHKKYNKFLIVSFIGVCLLGVYSYFYNDLKSEAASDLESDISSSLSDTKNTTNQAPTFAGSAKASEDTAFLMKLANLKTIKVDTKLFNNQSFMLLVDNNIKLEQAPFGRTNPFSPVDGFITSDSPTFTLITSPATSIVNKSATLNGSIEGAQSTNIFFEYGITEALGKSTIKVEPNLAGSFSSVISSLLPKTTYYYRSAANIEGVLVYGEIISFNTN